MVREIRITPSILNADRNNVQREIERIAQNSDLIHLDIMDNKFVPNQTWNFDQAQEIISNSPIPIDSHLMVAQVDLIAPEYAKAGSASVTFHVEAAHNIENTITSIKKYGARAAIALKPNTPLDPYLQYFSQIDMLLIMTVEPGFGGQSFISSMLPKIEAARREIGNRPIWLQVDGGISAATIEAAANAGADTFVAGSAVFTSDNPAAMVETLRALATG